MSPPRSILVVRGGALGDFILTLPVFSSLRRAFPNASIHILGRPSIAQLAVAGDLADQVKDLDSASLTGLFVREGGLDPGWSEYFAQFELVISFLYDPHGIFQENMRKLNSARFIQGIYRPAESGALHAKEAFLSCLKELSIPLGPLLPQLRLPMESASFPSPLVSFHPGSGSPSKNWPLARWVELTQALLQSGLDLLMIGGESDAHECTRLLKECTSPRLHTALNLPLVSLAGLLQRSRLHVGHDTGITHLAAALGIPCLVLWGPSQRRIWAPPHPHVTILEDTRGLLFLESAIVREAVGKALNPAFPLDS